MDLTHIFYRFGVALIIGFLIGLQREYASEQEDNLKDPEQFLFAGARTFALMALFGCTSAFIGEMAGSYWAAIVPMAVPGVLITVAYVMNASRGKLGMTTEMAALMTILIGAMCYWNHIVLATALGVVTMTLLSVKVQTHKLAHMISREDLYATIKFAIITAIILPILPQTGYGPAPFNVLIPFNIWLMVVFVSGISFSGYILMKFIGPGRGVGLDRPAWRFRIKHGRNLELFAAKPPRPAALTGIRPWDHGRMGGDVPSHHSHCGRAQQESAHLSVDAHDRGTARLGLLLHISLRAQEGPGLVRLGGFQEPL